MLLLPMIAGYLVAMVTPSFPFGHIPLGMAFCVLLGASDLRGQYDGIVPFEVDTAEVFTVIERDGLDRPDRVRHLALRTRPWSATEAFFHRSGTADSVVVDTVLLATDLYGWNAAGLLEHVHRAEPGRQGVYLFGPPLWTIALTRVQVGVMGRVGEHHRAAFQVENRGPREQTVVLLNVPDHVFPLGGPWVIPSGCTVEVAVQLVLPQGRRRTRLHLHLPEMTIPLLVNSQGYDVRTGDLLEGTGFVVPPRMAYLRTGGETMLEACDPRSGEVLMRYPVHAEHSLIDLGRLGLHEVELCILDLGLAVRHCAGATITR